MEKEYLHIIIADDDEDDQYICREALKKTNFRCKLSIAADGAQLLDLLSQKEVPRSAESRLPDFIILDINMPVVDGLSALEKIKSQDNLRDIPVFILSTTNRHEHVTKARQLGASNYFRKPNQMEGFERIMQEIVTSI